jgi:hypothetical protein
MTPRESMLHDHNALNQLILIRERDDLTDGVNDALGAGTGGARDWLKKGPAKSAGGDDSIKQWHGQSAKNNDFSSRIGRGNLLTVGIKVI